MLKRKRNVAVCVSSLPQINAALDIHEYLCQEHGIGCSISRVRQDGENLVGMAWYGDM
jgi:hypothetical protein